jgi:hypothetical protein
MPACACTSGSDRKGTGEALKTDIYETAARSESGSECDPSMRRRAVGAAPPGRLVGWL